MRSIELLFDSQEVAMPTHDMSARGTTAPGPSPRRAPLQTGRQARPRAPVRLTRRGRAVVVAGVLAAALTAALAAFLVGAWQARAAVTGAEGSSSVGRTVVVRPGQTLWEIARRADPGADPRVTVQRIIDVNALHGAWVGEGQRLRLPSSGM